MSNPRQTNFFTNTQYQLHRVTDIKKTQHPMWHVSKPTLTQPEAQERLNLGSDTKLVTTPTRRLQAKQVMSPVRYDNLKFSTFFFQNHVFKSIIIFIIIAEVTQNNIQCPHATTNNSKYPLLTELSDPPRMQR